MMFRIAFGLAALTAALHIFVGTFDTLAPMLDADLPEAVRGTLHACWHMVSLFLAVSAWFFWRRHPAAPVLAGMWVASALIFVLVAVWQGGVGGLLVLPQWILLALTGAIYLWANRDVPLRQRP